jgi:hypothetical protein
MIGLWSALSCAARMNSALPLLRPKFKNWRQSGRKDKAANINVPLGCVDIQEF